MQRGGDFEAECMPPGLSLDRVLREFTVDEVLALRKARNPQLDAAESQEEAHEHREAIAEFDELVSAGSRATLASTGLAETMALRAGLGSGLRLRVLGSAASCTGGRSM